jgi:DNA-binding response OmpR family regulator
MTRTAALLVDDDARLSALVAEYLGKNEVDVVLAADGERGLAALEKGRFDVILLDVMMPGIDGFEVVRRIRGGSHSAGLPGLREHSRTPILMLTAKGDDVDKIVGLELGADDYLAKPFNPRELLARIRAVLRRAPPGTGAGVGGGGEDARDRFRTGDLEIDFGAREVTVKGERQTVTHFEFELLSLLARAAGRVLSRDHLLDALKGEEYETFDRSIDVHISKLRGKIEENPKEPRYIKTVRGVGYVMPRANE